MIQEAGCDSGRGAAREGAPLALRCLGEPPCDGCHDSVPNVQQSRHGTGCLLAVMVPPPASGPACAARADDHETVIMTPVLRMPWDVSGQRSGAATGCLNRYRMLATRLPARVCTERARSAHCYGCTLTTWATCVLLLSVPWQGLLHGEEQHCTQDPSVGRCRRRAPPAIEAVHRETGRTLNTACGWKTTRSAASTDTWADRATAQAFIEGPGQGLQGSRSRCSMVKPPRCTSRPPSRQHGLTFGMWSTTAC